MHPLRSCKYSSSRLLDGPRTNLFSNVPGTLHKSILSTISHGLIYCLFYSLLLVCSQNKILGDGGVHGGEAHDVPHVLGGGHLGQLYYIYLQEIFDIIGI